MGYEHLLNLVKPSKEVAASETPAQQRKREKKIHAKKLYNSAVTKEESELYSQIAEHRPKMKVMEVDEFQNYYVWKERVLNDINGSMSDLKQRYTTMTQFKEDQ